MYYITWNFPRSLSVPVLISLRICGQHAGNAYQHKLYSALQSFLPEKKKSEERGMLLPMPQLSEHYGKTRTEINKYMNLFLRNTPTVRPRSCTYLRNTKIRCSDLALVM
jgi:hypothetical protein